MMNEATSMQETFEVIMMNIVLIFTSYCNFQTKTNSETNNGNGVFLDAYLRVSSPSPSRSRCFRSPFISSTTCFL